MSSGVRAEKPREVPGLSEVLENGGYQHCMATTDREVGGVLVGEFTPKGPPHVTGLVPAEHADQSATELTFTHDSWEYIHSTIDKHFPGQQIVGWYHTHPGYGLFMSAQDEFIHKSFFEHPGQIAVVVDPIAGEEAVFRWGRNGLVEHYRRPCPSVAGGVSGRANQVVSADAAPATAAAQAATAPGKGTDTAPRGVAAGEPVVPEEDSGAELEPLHGDPLGLRTHSTLAAMFYTAVIGVSIGVIIWVLTH